MRLRLLGWTWPELGRCNSPEASTFVSKVSQNDVLNVRNNFHPSLNTIKKTYPTHIIVPPAWNQAGMEPGCADTSTGKTGFAESKFKFWSLFQTYTQKSHKKKKNNMENIINRKQNGVWWLKTLSECSVLLSHKKYRAWETLRKLPLPKYFSLDRENSFWRKILFL